MATFEIKRPTLVSTLIIAALASTAGPVGCGVIQEVLEGTDTDTDTDTDSIGTADSTADSTGSPDVDTDTEGQTEGQTDGGQSTGESIPPPASECALQPLEIPDGGDPVLSVPLTVAVPDEPSALAIGIRVVHPDVSELSIELIDDNDVAHPLVISSMCAGPHIDAFFTDMATVPADGPCVGLVSAIEGDVQPMMPIEPLVSGVEQVEWTLRVQDLSPGNEGSLENWCITFRRGLS